MPFNDILALSGSTATNSDDAIEELVNSKKLIVVLEAATAPDIKSNFTREITP